MNITEVKRELNSYKHDEKLIEEKEQRLEEAKTLCEKITANISSIPKATNPVADRIAEYIAEILEIEEDVLKYTLKLKEKQRKIENTINNIEQPYKNILYFKYIKGMELTEISEKIIKKEYKWTCVLHGKALEEYRRCQNAD